MGADCFPHSFRNMKGKTYTRVTEKREKKRDIIWQKKGGGQRPVAVRLILTKVCVKLRKQMSRVCDEFDLDNDQLKWIFCYMCFYYFSSSFSVVSPFLHHCQRNFLNYYNLIREITEKFVNQQRRNDGKSCLQKKEKWWRILSTKKGKWERNNGELYLLKLWFGSFPWLWVARGEMTEKFVT